MFCNPDLTRRIKTMCVLYPFFLGGVMLFFGLGAFWVSDPENLDLMRKCASVNVVVFLLFAVSFFASFMFRKDLKELFERLSVKNFPLIAAGFSFLGLFLIIDGYFSFWR